MLTGLVRPADTPRARLQLLWPRQTVICFEKSKWGLSFASIGIVMGLRGLRGGRSDAAARENCRDIGPAQGGYGNPDSATIAEA